MMRRFLPTTLILFAAWPGAALLSAPPPEEWVPVRWEGGPLEAARRAGDKTPPEPAVHEALARWYEPSTLSLLEGSAVNCLLLSLAAGADPAVEMQQRQLVLRYARLARERGLAVLGVVYPGAGPAQVAAAVSEAGLDGVMLEGEFPDEFRFRQSLDKALRGAGSKALVLAVSPAGELRKDSVSPVVAVEGVVPGVVQTGDAAVASATAGLWIDSNIWLARSLHPAAAGRPIWIRHGYGTGDLAMLLRSIADAAAAGGRWIVALPDGLRAGLFRKDDGAVSDWREINAYISFFERQKQWRELPAFGNVAIVLDAAGANLAHSEEYLNLIARRQIPYRVIERAKLAAGSLEGLRAVVAFDLAPPSEVERKILMAFVARGGLLLGGPPWGKPPADQSYNVLASGEGELVVYKDDAPDPEGVARDMNDLLTTPELGVSLFDAPAVLSYVSGPASGVRLLVQAVNYAGQPAETVTIWVTGKYSSARLLEPGSPPAVLPLRQSGGRTEVVLKNLAVYGAVELE